MPQQREGQRRTTNAFDGMLTQSVRTYSSAPTIRTNVGEITCSGTENHFKYGPRSEMPFYGTTMQPRMSNGRTAASQGLAVRRSDTYD